MSGQNGQAASDVLTICSIIKERSISLFPAPYSGVTPALVSTVAVRGEVQSTMDFSSMRTMDTMVLTNRFEFNTEGRTYSYEEILSTFNVAIAHVEMLTESFENVPFITLKSLEGPGISCVVKPTRGSLRLHIEYTVTFNLGSEEERRAQLCLGPTSRVTTQNGTVTVDVPRSRLSGPYTLTINGVHTSA